MGLNRESGESSQNVGRSRGLADILDEGTSSSFIVMEDCGKSGRKGETALLESTSIFDLSAYPASYGELDRTIIEKLIDLASIHSALDEIASPSSPRKPSNGRLGPEHVQIDKSSARGQLSYTHADLAIEASGTFSSARANVCVFAGKWQYECLISCAWNSGIQQIGWAPLSCPFTAEEGVGDAPDSYAYDGKRVKKWHVRPQAYGDAWATGDMIGSCIDLDSGEISFYRNGRPLGVAFKGIKTISAGLAYFPSVSLSHAEKCEVGSTL